MGKVIDFFKENSYAILGLILVSSGLFSIGVSIITINVSDYWFSSYLTLGLVSIEIAIHSVGMSGKSDEKMQSIADGDFYDLTIRFWDEDRAPLLYDEDDLNERDTLSWQLGNIFRRGEKLKKWADSEIQEKLIKEFKIFLERLRPTPCTKYWVEVKNYKGTAKIAISFKTENDDMKNELINELTNWLGPKQPDEANREYLDKHLMTI